MAGRIRLPFSVRKPDYGAELTQADTTVSCIDILFVLLLSAIVAWVNYLWIAGDSGPLLEHSGRSIQESVLLWQRLCEHKGFRAGVYPPLSYLAAAVSYSVFGLSQVSAIASQLFFVLPYLFGSWWIGRELGGRWGGLLVCIAAAGNTWFSFLTHGFFLEISLTAMVACAFALGATAKWEQKPWIACLFGFLLGLGMLSKWAFLFFIAPVIAWHILKAFRTGGQAGILAWSAILSAVLTGAALYWTTQLSSWAFPWKTYLLALDAWCAVAAIGWYCYRKTGWNAGVALSWELCLGFIVSGWWYFQSLWELEAKAAGDFGQGYSEAQALILLIGTLVSCYWFITFFFAVGAVRNCIYKETRIITVLAIACTLSGLLFYVYSRVPPGPRYMLPATVFVLAIAFAWLGRYRPARYLAAGVLAVISLLQIASFLLPSSMWNSHYSGLNEQVLSFRMGTVPGPSTEHLPVGQTVERIHQELDITHEYRITGIILPHSRLDADAVMLESLLRGRMIDIEHYLPGRTRNEPQTSLMLVIGEKPDSFSKEVPELKKCKQLQVWEVPKWGAWALYKHPTRLDTRPLPGGTDGPPIIAPQPSN